MNPVTLARRPIALVCLAVAALALTGCGTEPVHPTLQAAQASGQLPPLVPTRRFVANVDAHVLLNDCGATLCCALSDCGHVAPWCSDLMTRPHRYDSSPEKQLETTFSTCLSPSRTMRPSQVKSISSLKAHAAEVLMQLAE